MADDVARCEECNSETEEAGNPILLCDGEGCEHAYHMQCLER